jgi:hypothetical protein
MRQFRTLSALFAALAAAGLAATAAPAASITVAMSGLDNPRGLAWGPEGGLYVAEAGTGQLGGPCVQLARGPACYSPTGGISRLWRGEQERVVAGLPSVINLGEGGVSGPQHISFQGRGGGYVAIGFGGDPALRAGLGDVGSLMATLVKFEPSGEWRVVADVGGFETAHNPAGGPLDSNPYGLLAEPGRRFVTDAGGNDLLEVAANGDVSLVTTFPSLPAPPPFLRSDPVPTDVERGPDGALYVSQLTGVPFVAGSAGIYRIVPGEPPQLYAGGFKTITDFSFGDDGSIYLVEYASAPMFLGGPGSLVRVAPDGTRTIITTALLRPTGVVAGPDGELYVSQKGGLGDLAGVGEVLRIEP